MKATFTPKVSRNTEVTLKITATLEEWESLVKLLPREWPSWQFASLVRHAVEEYDRHIESEQEING